MPGHGIGRNVAASVANAATQIAVALVSVPLVISGIGLRGYGVWTLAQAGIAYVATAEAGLGPAVQRHVAVAAGEGDDRRIAGLLWGSVGLYVVLGAVAAGACLVLGEPFVDVFDVPVPLRADAVDMVTLLGPAVALTLVAAGFGNVQQGVERFAAYAWSNAAGAVAFLAVLAAEAAGELTLTGLARATIAQQGCIALVRLWLLRRTWSHRPRLAAGEARAVLGFSARLQATTLASVVNNQTDKVVVGLVASTAAVGQVGIASQVAEAGRMVGVGALSPMISRMAVLHGAGTDATLPRLNRLWTLAVIGGTAIGLASLYPLIRGWLGAGHDDAVGYAALLVAAYGANLLGGGVTAYLRAVGRPGLEARAALLIVALNVALTVALGLAVGPYGVVGATALAYWAGTAWLLRRADAQIPPGSWAFLSWRAGAMAVVAAVAAGAWGLAAVQVLPTGVALVAAGAGAVGAFAGYLAWATRTRPSLRAFRALLA